MIHMSPAIDRFLVRIREVSGSGISDYELFSDFEFRISCFLRISDLIAAAGRAVLVPQAT
jgi:hypothetical protein